MTATDVNHLIRNRRSIYPNRFIPDKPIPKEVLMDLLENANWAPNHRRTAPWRFKVLVSQESRKRLGDYLGDHYETNTPAEKFSPLKHKRTMKKPLQSAAVIAICMKRDEEGRVPEHEEIAAVAMAVQNLWLSCAAHGLGGYWSSPEALLQAGGFLGLGEGERCLGAFYIGYVEGEAPAGQRHPIGDKVTWL